MTPATLGFAPHSGWAAVVALAGEPRAPRVVARQRIEMADRKLAGSAQPYHAAEGLPLRDAERLLRRRSESAKAMAEEAIGVLVEELRAQAVRLRAAGILQSSGRLGRTLEVTLASHALIHTADGEHFRDALAFACQRHGLAVTRVPARELSLRAAASLRATPDALAGRVAQLGRGLGPPWGADQKAAALLAWLLLGGGATRVA